MVAMVVTPAPGDAQEGLREMKMRQPGMALQHHETVQEVGLSS